MAAIAERVIAGQIVNCLDIVDGLEHAPGAFTGLFAGSSLASAPRRRASRAGR